MTTEPHATDYYQLIVGCHSPSLGVTVFLAVEVSDPAPPGVEDVHYAIPDMCMDAANSLFDADDFFVLSAQQWREATAGEGETVQ